MKTLPTRTITLDIDPSQVEAIKAELAEVKVVADQLWEVYNNTVKDTISKAVAAWDKYQAGLDQHGICPTLIGYRYRKNLKYGQR